MKIVANAALIGCLGLCAACSSSTSSPPASQGDPGNQGGGGTASGSGGSMANGGNGNTGGSTANGGNGNSGGSGGGAPDASTASGGTGNGGGATDSGGPNPDLVDDGGVPLVGQCPSGFTPKEGDNTNFVSDGKGRNFSVLLPKDTSTPRPVFVALTGTVQTEHAFVVQSGLNKLPDDGWIVLVPVRTCSQEGTNCSTNGSDGRIWEPWYDGTNPRTDDPGPDVRFVESMVQCAATAWPVDKNRIYVGGISAGGSFTNRNMVFNSALFAGGAPCSGDWYNGGVLPKNPKPMDPSIVIVAWGGPNDQWPDTNPLAVYAGETKAASQYYSSQSNVVTVSCTHSEGHIWPHDLTPYIAQTLRSHPKGTPVSNFTLQTPPTGYSCVLGPYTDH